MEDHGYDLDLSILCRFCDYDSYKVPEVEGLTPSQRRRIEELCKLCVESFKRNAVNG